VSTICGGGFLPAFMVQTASEKGVSKWRKVRSQSTIQLWNVNIYWSKPFGGRISYFGLKEQGQWDKAGLGYGFGGRWEDSVSEVTGCISKGKHLESQEGLQQKQGKKGKERGHACKPHLIRGLTSGHRRLAIPLVEG
jgi:hypothetical protein